MNGIDKIIERINAEARSEAEAVRSEAEKKCAEIAAEFSRSADAESKKILDAGAGASEAYYSRLVGAADMEARRALLNMKQELINEAFVLAEKKILSMPEDKYIDFLARLAKSASKTGKEEIILSAKDKSIAGAKLAELTGLKISDETRDINGGLYLKDGNIETNCSVATLIEMGRNELGPQLANMLFN